MTTPREQGEPANPTAIDPFVLYRGYPSDRILASAILSADRRMDAAAVERLMTVSGSRYIRRFVSSVENIVSIQTAVADQGPLRLEALVAETELNANLVTSCVLWLAKFDCVQIRNPG